MSSLLTVLPKPGNDKKGWPWAEETDPSIYDGRILYPKISIITPTYNQGEFIEETIRSILLQNYPNLEYIIIDGGSTDNTIEIIKKYERWITYWVSEKDRGQSHAINKGLEKCTGEICNWINSDDCLAANALYLVHQGLADSEVLAFSGNSMVEYDSLKEPVVFRTTLLNEDINTHLANCSFCQPGTFFKMTAFRQITPLEESLHMNMDMYMWYRFVCLYGMEKIRYTDEIICTVKAHKEAKTVKNFKKSYLDKQRLFDSLFMAIDQSYTPKSDVLPLIISPAIQRKINYRALKKHYLRTHLWEIDMEGKIKHVRVANLLKWFFT